MIKQWIFLGFLFLWTIICGQAQPICLIPQKAIYYSYKSLGKTDSILNLTKEINSKILSTNISSTIQSIQYKLLYYKPNLYYNDYNQTQKYESDQSINVMLGKMTLGFIFNYSIVSKQSTKTGYALGSIVLDQTYFIKKLIKQDNYLQWDLQLINNLTSNQQLTIQYSYPKITYDEKLAYESILNNPSLVKERMFSELNILYKQLLKQHLNNQHLAELSTFQYKYKGHSFNYANNVKNFSLSVNPQEGLQIYIYWQILGGSNLDCSQKEITIDLNFGGIQEVLSISVMRDTLKSALQKGLIDVTIDKDWEVPTFQFYMGDLQYSILNSAKYKADDPFLVRCKWNRNNSHVKLTAFSYDQLYSEFFINCILEDNNSNKLLQMDLLLYFVIKLIAEQNYLVFRVQKSQIYSFNCKSLDPKFIVTNKQFLRYNIEKILQGLNQKPVLGTNWTTMRRRFPAVYIPNQENVVIFDISEV